MTLTQRLTREPALILGLVTSTTGLLILFGIDLTAEQAGGILTFIGALVALLRFIVTPTSEVLAQEQPGGTGHDETGATTVIGAISIVLLGAAAAVLVFVVLAVVGVIPS